MSNVHRVVKDDLERQVIHNIAEFGWHCVNVIEDDGHPPWSFTIGLYETYNFPELIVIGRSRATAHAMLKTLSDDIELNDPPNLANPDGHLLLGMKCHFLKVLPRYYSDYIGFALWYYRANEYSPCIKSAGPTTKVSIPGKKVPRQSSRNGNRYWERLPPFRIPADLDQGSLPRHCTDMFIAKSKMTALGRISIPAEVRNRLDIRPGSRLEWYDENGKIVVQRAGSFSSMDIHRAPVVSGR